MNKGKNFAAHYSFGFWGQVLGLGLGLGFWVFYGFGQLYCMVHKKHLFACGECRVYYRCVCLHLSDSCQHVSVQHVRSGICLKRIEHITWSFWNWTTVLWGPSSFGRSCPKGHRFRSPMAKDTRVYKGTWSFIEVCKGLERHIGVCKDMRRLIGVSENMGSHLCTEGKRYSSVTLATVDGVFV